MLCYECQIGLFVDCIAGMLKRRLFDGDSLEDVGLAKEPGYEANVGQAYSLFLLV